jgi:hypothetical protein
VPPEGNPTPWNDFELRLAVARPLGKRAGETKLFTKVNKFEDVSQAGFGSLGQIEAPLIDQGKKYVRYELRVNETEYRFIFDHQYYKRAKLDAAAQQAKVEFPEGSIEIKAAWRELPDDPDTLSHFYWRDAFVLDWDKNGKEVLVPVKAGLVGLHIVTKTKQRPNWIWSTFEHEDNVVSAGGLKPPSFTSNPNGTPWAEPGPKRPDGWEAVQKGKPLPELAPVAVSRRLDLTKFPSTEKINARYRGHKDVVNSVWKHYRLIRTQWPIRAPSTAQDGRPSPNTDVANVTMETYRQKVTCMACHETAAKCRMVYFLELRVAPGPARQNLEAALRRLDPGPK